MEEEENDENDRREKNFEQKKILNRISEFSPWKFILV